MISPVVTFEDGRQARRTRTRQRLLRVARSLMEHHGAGRMTMEAIADQAGVSRRTVYDHFGSRAGLLLAIVVEADRAVGVEERLAPVFGAPTGLEALRRLIDLMAEVTPPRLDLATAFERARQEDADASAAWDDRMAGRMQGCLFLAKRIEQDGDLRASLTVHEAADIIYMAISWQMWRILVEERGWTPDQWTSRVRDLLERSLTGRQ